MKRKQLSGKHIGIVFGTFAPMHVGHVDLITKAKRANDNVLVIVSGSNTQEDRGTRAGLSLNRRFRYVREVFYDDELVVVDKLDEAGMPAYPEGWVPWVNRVKELIAKNTVSYTHLIKISIETICCHELIMISLFNNIPIFHHKDKISISNS